MKYLVLLLLTGCAQVPDTGVTYSVKYGDAEIEVANYTDNEVIEVEYESKDGRRLILRKQGVDNTSPATVLSTAQIQLNAQNTQTQVEVIKMMREILKEYKSLRSIGNE
jgi:hypothetical protein